MNKIQPYKNEYILSFVYRFAEANGLSLKQLSKIICVNEMEVLPTIRNIDMDRLEKISGMSPFRLLNSNSLFFALAPFFTMFNRDAFLINYFYKNCDTELHKLVPKENIIREFNICPICYAKRRAIMRYHLLPGVTACYEHGVKLIKYSSYEEAMNNKVTVSSKANIKDIRYAEYAKRFADLKPKIQINHYLLDDYNNYFINEINRLIKLCNSPNLIEKELDYSKACHLRKYYDDVTKDAYYFSSEGKRIFGNPKNSIGKSINTIFKEIVENNGDQLNSEFKSLSYSVSITHRNRFISCKGKNYIMKFIYPYRRNMDNLPIAYNYLNDKYKIINYSDGYTTIKCKKCETVRTIHYINTNVHCPICDEKSITIGKYILNKLEYHNFTLLDNDNWNAHLLCRKCQYRFSFDFSQNNKPRCIRCNPIEEYELLFSELYICFGIDDRTFTGEQASHLKHYSEDSFNKLYEESYIMELNDSKALGGRYKCIG